MVSGSRRCATTEKAACRVRSVKTSLTISGLSDIRMIDRRHGARQCANPTTAPQVIGSSYL